MARKDLTCFIFPEIAENDVALILMDRRPDEHHHTEDMEPPSLHQEIFPYHIDCRNKNCVVSQCCKVSEARRTEKSHSQQNTFIHLLCSSWLQNYADRISQVQEEEHQSRLVPQPGAASLAPGRKFHNDTFSCSFFKCFKQSSALSPTLVMYSCVVRQPC